MNNNPPNDSDDKGDLPDSDFEHVIRHAPLVSIDLIVRDKLGLYLLGRRKNEPAKGMFFVLGGRIRKGENVDMAFRRITKVELGVEKQRGEAIFMGVFDHEYVSSRFGEEGFRTQYVVLGYELVLAERCKPPFDQHDLFVWWFEEAILASPEVHENTKAYFRRSFMWSEAQYGALSARRNALNTMLWQTPALCLTAIAFLLNVAGNKNSYFQIRVITCLLAILVSLVSLQLFCRHRKLERKDAILLHNFETKNRQLGYATVNAKPERSILKPCDWSSFWIWVFLFLLFVIASGMLLNDNLKNSWEYKPDPSTNSVSSSSAQPGPMTPVTNFASFQSKELPNSSAVQTSSPSVAALNLVLMTNASSLKTVQTLGPKTDADRFAPASDINLLMGTNEPPTNTLHK